VADAAVERHPNLLLEERVEDDGGASGIFEALHRVDVIAEWRCARHERVRETHPEI
jgi:hypothetical protein